MRKSKLGRHYLYSLKVILGKTQIMLIFGLRILPYLFLLDLLELKPPSD